MVYKRLKVSVHPKVINDYVLGALKMDVAYAVILFGHCFAELVGFVIHIYQAPNESSYETRGAGVPLAGEPKRY